MAPREVRLAALAQREALDSEDAEARYWYGRALLREGRTEEARRQWEQGLQLDLGMTGKAFLFGLGATVLTGLLFGPIVVLLASLLATLYPAWRASRTQPAEALRYE